MQKFSRVRRLGAVFSKGRHQRNRSGMIWEFSEVNWQIPDWPENIEMAEWPLSVKKLCEYLISYQKTLKDWEPNIQTIKLTHSIPMNFLWYFQGVEKGCIGNEWVNNSIKNQIYPKITRNTSLWADSTIWEYRQGSRCFYHTTWEKQICKKNSISRHSVSVHIIGN